MPRREQILHEAQQGQEEEKIKSSGHVPFLCFSPSSRGAGDVVLSDFLSCASGPIRKVRQPHQHNITAQHSTAQHWLPRTDAPQSGKRSRSIVARWSRRHTRWLAVFRSEVRVSPNPLRPVDVAEASCAEMSIPAHAVCLLFAWRSRKNILISVIVARSGLQGLVCTIQRANFSIDTKSGLYPSSCGRSAAAPAEKLQGERQTQDGEHHNAHEARWPGPSLQMGCCARKSIPETCRLNTPDRVAPGAGPHLDSKTQISPKVSPTIQKIVRQSDPDDDCEQAAGLSSGSPAAEASWRLFDGRAQIREPASAHRAEKRNHSNEQSHEGMDAEAGKQRTTSSRVLNRSGRWESAQEGIDSLQGRPIYAPLARFSNPSGAPLWCSTCHPPILMPTVVG